MDDQMLLIKLIAAVSSRTAKENLLTNVDKLILFYAYHPDKRYYIKGNWNPRNSSGTNQLNQMTWRILNLFASGTYRGAKAAHTYHEYIWSLSPESGELFNRILNKDLKCGVSIKTINKMYPGLIPLESCMLCKDLESNRLSYPCYTSIKIDGDRGIFKPGIGFISRTGKKITGLEHLEEPLQRIGIATDGELRDSTRSFSRSSGLIRSNKEHKPNVRFFVFDTAINSHKPFHERLELLRTKYHKCHSHIVVVPHLKCNNRVELSTRYKAAVKAGHEGLVVKAYSHMYQRKRSYDWMRMVPDVPTEVKVVGTTSGKAGSKYDGMCGALVVEFEGKTQKVGSGLDDEERYEYYHQPELIVGQTIEVVYKGLTDHGKMRQPRYKRIRTDKGAD